MEPAGHDLPGRQRQRMLDMLDLRSRFAPAKLARPLLDTNPAALPATQRPGQDPAARLSHTAIR